jgi:hypothetical protein
MVEGQIYFSMEINILENIEMENQKDKDNIYGLMDHIMKVDLNLG